MISATSSVQRSQSTASSLRAKKLSRLLAPPKVTLRIREFLLRSCLLIIDPFNPNDRIRDTTWSESLRIQPNLLRHIFRLSRRWRRDMEATRITVDEVKERLDRGEQFA